MVKGIVRNIDSLGRVTIPKEMLKTLKVNNGDPVDIYFSNGVILIEPVKLQCVCCGDKNEDKLVTIDDVHMCPNCIKVFNIAAQGERKHE